MRMVLKSLASVGFHCCNFSPKNSFYFILIRMSFFHSTLFSKSQNLVFLQYGPKVPELIWKIMFFISSNSIKLTATNVTVNLCTLAEILKCHNPYCMQMCSDVFIYLDLSQCSTISFIMEIKTNGLNSNKLIICSAEYVIATITVVMCRICHKQINETEENKSYEINDTTRINVFTRQRQICTDENTMLKTQ